MKSLVDYGTPEEEAWRWKILPWYIRFQRIRDSYLYTAKYYDKPDGQDLMSKIIAVNRPALQYGVTAGLCYSFMHSKQADWQTHTGRVLYFAWPFATAATSFATVTYFSTKIRGKDDYFNYALGAGAAGSVIGFWRNCHITGWNAAAFFCLCAYVQRIRIEENFKWWNYQEQMPGDHRWHKCNWDIYKDPLPKNYTTSTEESKSEKNNTA